MTAPSPSQPPLRSVGAPISRADMEAIVEEWKAILGLERWNLVVEWDKPLDDDDAFGWFQAWGDYDAGFLRFAKSFPTWEREFATKVVVHELLHALFRESDAAAVACKPMLHKQAGTLFDEAYTRANEALVERLAWRLTELAAR